MATASTAVRLCGTEQPDVQSRVLTRGRALRRARERRAALHPARRRRGAARHRVPRPRRELGHVHAGDSRPRRSTRRRTASPSPIAAPAPTRSASSPTTRRSTGRATARSPSRSMAEPLTDVLTNRTGFIVLHPVEGVAGRPVTVLHVDGREEKADVPRADQPRPALLRHPRADARGGARRLGHLHHGERRRLRDGGPAQLDRRLLQDLCAPAAPAVALHAPEGREGRAVGPAELFRPHPRRRVRRGAAADPGRDRRGDRRQDAGDRHRRSGREAEHAAVGAPARREARAAIAGLRDRPPACRRRGALESYRKLGEADRRRDHARDRHARQHGSRGRACAGRRGCSRSRARAGGGLGLPRPYLESDQPSGPWPEIAPEEEIAAAARAPFPARSSAAAWTPISPSSTASARRPRSRLRHPHDLPDRACGRRPLGDGDPRGAAAPDALDPRHDRRQALPHRPERDRLPREPLRQGAVRRTPATAASARQIDPRQRGLFNAAWTLGYVAAWRAAASRRSPSARRPARSASSTARPTTRSRTSTSSPARPSIRPST